MNIIKKYISYNDYQYRQTWDDFYSFSNMTDRLYKKCVKNIEPFDNNHNSKRIIKELFYKLIFDIKTTPILMKKIVSRDYNCPVCGTVFRATINTETLEFNITQHNKSNVCDATLYQDTEFFITVNNEELIISSRFSQYTNFVSMKSRHEYTRALNNTLTNGVNILLQDKSDLNIYSKNNTTKIMNDFSSTMKLVGSLDSTQFLQFSTSISSLHYTSVEYVSMKLENGLYKIINHSEKVSEFDDDQTLVTIERVK